MYYNKISTRILRGNGDVGVLGNLGENKGQLSIFYSMVLKHDLGPAVTTVEFALMGITPIKLKKTNGLVY